MKAFRSYSYAVLHATVLCFFLPFDLWRWFFFSLLPLSDAMSPEENMVYLDHKKILELSPTSSFCSPSVSPFLLPFLQDINFHVFMGKGEGDTKSYLTLHG